MRDSISLSFWNKTRGELPLMKLCKRTIEIRGFQIEDRDSKDLSKLRIYKTDKGSFNRTVALGDQTAVVFSKIGVVTLKFSKVVQDFLHPIFRGRVLTADMNKN